MKPGTRWMMAAIGRPSSKTTGSLTADGYCFRYHRANWRARETFPKTLRFSAIAPVDIVNTLSDCDRMSCERRDLNPDGFPRRLLRPGRGWSFLPIPGHSWVPRSASRSFPITSAHREGHLKDIEPVTCSLNPG